MGRIKPLFSQSINQSVLICAHGQTDRHTHLNTGRRGNDECLSTLPGLSRAVCDAIKVHTARPNADADANTIVTSRRPVASLGGHRADESTDRPTDGRVITLSTGHQHSTRRARPPAALSLHLVQLVVFLSNVISDSAFRRRLLHNTRAPNYVLDKTSYRAACRRWQFDGTQPPGECF